MSVYVDPLLEHGGSRSFKWTRSCHMYADHAEELHAMARGLGLRREWFQDKDKLPHYDLVSTKRQAALRAGAIEHTREQMVQFMRARGGEKSLSLFSGTVG